MNIWRFIIFWRYLLLACLVLVAAGQYLCVGLPKFTLPAILHPSSLPGKYEKIEEGMTEGQVMEILGTPQYRSEIAPMDMIIMKWTEARDEIVLIFHWTDIGRVYQKGLFTKSAWPAAQEVHSEGGGRTSLASDSGRDVGLAELIGIHRGRRG
jgi:hypothetical protein